MRVRYTASVRFGPRVGVAARFASILSVALTQCVRPATVVEVAVETNTDPSRSFQLRACVAVSGQAIDESTCEVRATHGGPLEPEPFYGSFGVQPPRGWNGESSVDVLLIATVAADEQRPEIRFRRRLRFGFVRERNLIQRVFLPVECGSPSAGCTQTPADQCTVAAVCEEAGTTCGDDAQCIPVAVTPEVRDAGVVVDVLPPRRLVDASVRDVPSRMDVPNAPDAQDVVVTDRPDAFDTGISQPDAGPVRPRLAYPWSGMVVGSAPVTFRWVVPNDGTRWLWQLCRDAGCTSLVMQQESATTNVRLAPTFPQRPSRYWWRVTSPTAIGDPMRTSASFPVYTASNNGQCIEPAALDINDDGLTDFVGAAHNATEGGIAGAGNARLFIGARGAPNSNALRAFAGPPEVNAHFGTAIGSTDIDGDGISDLAITAPGYRSNAGSVSVYLGNRTGMAFRGFNISPGFAMGVQFGLSIQGAGDVDGDGYGDMIVGGAENAWVAFGRASGQFDFVAIPKPASMGATSGFGASVAGGCDFDNDGFGDVIVSAPSTMTMMGIRGAVHVFRGGAARTFTAPNSTLASATGSDEFGWAVSCGDLNSDGFADVVVSAPRAGGTGGILYYSGRMAGGFALVNQLQGGNAGDNFGYSLAANRDINRDGRCDVVVGAHTGSFNMMSRSGYVGIVGLNGMGMLTGVVRFADAMVADQFGRSVAMVGDSDGDGIGDLIVGADLATRMALMNCGLLSWFAGVLGNLPANANARVRYPGLAASDTFGGAIIH